MLAQKRITCPRTRGLVPAKAMAFLARLAYNVSRPWLEVRAKVLMGLWTAKKWPTFQAQKPCRRLSSESQKSKIFLAALYAFSADTVSKRANFFVMPLSKKLGRYGHQIAYECHDIQQFYARFLAFLPKAFHSGLSWVRGNYDAGRRRWREWLQLWRRR